MTLNSVATAITSAPRVADIGLSGMSIGLEDERRPAGRQRDREQRHERSGERAVEGEQDEPDGEQADDRQPVAGAGQLLVGVGGQHRQADDLGADARPAGSSSERMSAISASCSSSGITGIRNETLATSPESERERIACEKYGGTVSSTRAMRAASGGRPELKSKRSDSAGPGQSSVARSQAARARRRRIRVRRGPAA